MKYIIANLRTIFIGVLAGIAISCKNQSKHFTCDPSCVTNKNVSHSEIKQSNHGERQTNIVFCTLLNLFIECIVKKTIMYNFNYK